MKKRYLLPIIAMVCMLPGFAKASCSTDRIAELSKMASNVNISYTYEIGNSGAEFKITMNNLTPDIYLGNDLYDKTYSGQGEVKDDFIYLYGQTITYTIYSNDNSCKGEALSNKYVTLPYYNVFSRLDECKEHPKFTYCKQWQDTKGLTMDDFDKALAEYTKDGTNPNSKETNKASFFEKYKVYILSGAAAATIAIIALFTVIIVKRRKRLF